MAKNEARREALLDGALAVLAREGSRGLTHRATDTEVGVPVGTCVNYFRSREALLIASAERVFERLTPSTAALAALHERAVGQSARDHAVVLMEALMERVMAQPELQIALLELRLESTRRPSLASLLAETLRTALAHDWEFHQQAQLPGGRETVVLMHVVFEGLILNSITLPSVLEVAGRRDIIEKLVDAVIP